MTGAWSVTHSQGSKPWKLGWAGPSWAILSQECSHLCLVAEQSRYVRKAARSCDNTARSPQTPEEGEKRYPWPHQMSPGRKTFTEEHFLPLGEFTVLRTEGWKGWMKGADLGASLPLAVSLLLS